MKTLVIITLFLTSVVSFSQTSAVLKDSSDLEEFERYVKSILKTPKDTTLSSVSQNRYRIHFMTSCPYSEYFYSSQISTQHIGGATFLERNAEADEFDINYTPSYPYMCAENPTRVLDTISYQINDSHPQPDNIGVFYGVFLDKYNLGLLEGFQVAVSYNNGQYVILEGSYIMQYGNQTNWGTTETLYLERVD